MKRLVELIKNMLMRNKNKVSFSDKPPAIDFEAVAKKMLDKAQKMTYWPSDTIVEYMLRLVYKELAVCDIKSPLAEDVRIACIQALADRDHPSSSPSAEQNLAEKLRKIYAKHYLVTHTAIR